MGAGTIISCETGWRDSSTERVGQLPQRDNGQESPVEWRPTSDAGGGPVPRNLGTLVINVWREAEHAEPLRARLTSRSVDDPEATTSYAASLETVLADVTEWFLRLTRTQ